MSDSFLLILTGPPGAGKSTSGKLFASKFESSAMLEADFFWASLVNGAIEPWTKEAGSQNETMLRAALASAAMLTNAGYATVIEGIIGPWYMDLVRDELSRVSRPIRYLVLRPDIDVCLQRARTRTMDPRHANALRDEGPIRHMYEEFSNLGEFEDNVIDTSNQEPQETAQWIFDRFEDPRYGL